MLLALILLKEPRQRPSVPSPMGGGHWALERASVQISAPSPPPTPLPSAPVVGPHSLPPFFN